MADLLAHVLVAYAALTVASWRVSWVDERWIAVGMCGAAIPDLTRVGIVLDADAVGAVLGVPFSYGHLGTLGGLVVVAGAVAVVFDPERRIRAYAALLAGGGLALLLDGLRMYADGRAGFWLYPLWWRPPTPNLYVSADARVTLVAVVVALVVFAVHEGVHHRMVERATT